MDRRATLKTLLGQSKKIKNKAKTQLTSNAGLDPYTGPWEFQQAAHLLRRTTFGPTNARIKQSVDLGFAATIQQLMASLPLPSPPVNYFYEFDPNVPIGETWIDQPYPIIGFNEARNSRSRSLRAWTAFQIYEEGISIREKMTLFWHNHFVTADINDPKYRYNYINRLRSHALGNFKTFVKEITIDPSMLIYLNGNQNTKNAPNENYARELLELFTIGKGPLVGPGDYTNYTEDDVVAMAKVLTGWIANGFNDLLGNPIEAVYVQNRHDITDKQLSERFDNTVIANANENEYANLIDVIFQQDEVAYFICRKLYRWFVFHDISDDIEINIIDPMAQMFINNNYEIVPVVEALISSEHFFEEANRGCLIKNPWDFTLGMIKELGIQIPTEIDKYYNSFQVVFDVPAILQMGYYDAPSVAGWSAYYQEPSYYQLWINTVTLPIRTYLSTVVAIDGVFVTEDERARVNFLEMVNAFDNPFEVNPLIDEFVRMLLSKDISQNQKDYLKEILIPGLPDFEWNAEYSEYASDPNNEDLAISVSNKLRNMVIAIMSLPEYQLS